MDWKFWVLVVLSIIVVWAVISILHVLKRFLDRYSEWYKTYGDYNEDRYIIKKSKKSKKKK